MATAIAPSLEWQQASPDHYVRGPMASTEGRLIYAIGDIHGRYDLLKSLLAEIAADADAAARGDRPLLVFLGDYIDRGPDSAQVIEALLWLERRSPFEVKLLRGNHEQCLLDFLDDPIGGAAWLRFGGVETLASYGVSEPADEGDMIAARDDLLDRLPAAHLKLLERMPLCLSIGDFVFAHAGIRPGVRLADPRAEDLLWIREQFLESRDLHPKVVVHGHSWASDEPEIRANRIGLDTGAFTTDRLTAARLYDGSVRIVRAS